MKKEIIISDYRGRKKKIVINDFEMVKAIYVLEISGDQALDVLYKDGRTAYFDSCDTRTTDYFDDGYFLELTDEALKIFSETNQNILEREDE